MFSSSCLVSRSFILRITSSQLCIFGIKICSQTENIQVMSVMSLLLNDAPTGAASSSWAICWASESPIRYELDKLWLRVRRKTYGESPWWRAPKTNFKFCQVPKSKFTSTWHVVIITGARESHRASNANHLLETDRRWPSSRYSNQHTYHWWVPGMSSYGPHWQDLKLKQYLLVSSFSQKQHLLTALHAPLYSLTTLINDSRYQYSDTAVSLLHSSPRGTMLTVSIEMPTIIYLSCLLVCRTLLWTINR